MHNAEMISRCWPEWKAVEKLGTGSYGTVYKCCKTELGVDVYSAIKVITIEQGYDDDYTIALPDEQTVYEYYKGYVTDYLDEIRIMSEVKGCANIVSVEDFRVVEHEDKSGWTILIRMELLNSFQAYMRANKLSEKEVIKLGLDICNALQFCNAYDVIHRDIKPANILMTKDGTFKLSDFGIARKLEGAKSGMSNKGTRSYIAPEVAMNKPYSANVDVYSLGILLYQLMNNNLIPFLQQTDGRITHQDLQNALEMRMQDVTYTYPCNASPAFGKVILKACDFNPETRYASAAEMKKDLEALLTTSSTQEPPTTAPSPPPPPPPPPPDKKKINKKTIAIVAAAICAVVLMAVVMIGLVNRDKTINSDTVASTQSALSQTTTGATESATEKQNAEQIALQKAKDLYDAENYEEAFAAFSRLAEKGNAEGRAYVGLCYFYGNGVEKSCDTALEYFYKSADQGNAEGQFWIGFCYFYGNGVKQSKQTAVAWYLKSAEQGHALAQYWVGFCCENGEGVEKSIEKAAEWYLKSAEQGNVNAQCRIAGLYEKGNGVKKSIVKANEWYQKAADNGNTYAQKWIEENQ